VFFSKIRKQLLALCGLGLFFSFAGAAFAAYPERSINWVVPVPAGGGTDMWNRALANVMAGVLGQKIVLSNMVGAGGATGTAYVWQSQHDGYTLCGANDSNPSHAVMTGIPQTAARNWEFFIAGGSPGVLCVNAESGFKDFKILVEEARRQPGKIKISCSTGSVWFAQASVLGRYCDLPLGNVPIAGSQPAILSCVAGETSAVVAELGTGADFIKAGKLVPLAVMQDEDYEMSGYGTIPSIVTFLPAYRNYLPLQQWLGFMVPVDTPEDAKAVLRNAFLTAMRSPEMEAFRLSQYGVFYALSGKEALDFAQKSESITSWLLHEMGMAQHNPEKFGIAKP
jgi:tripartite-type tricarboxylate transporter receptor subunit TctC